MSKPASMPDNASGIPMLGIIAGGGRLPLQLVESCQSIGRPFFLLALEDIVDKEAIHHIPHELTRLGAVGESLEKLRKAGVKELVLAGKVRRPSMASLRPDMLGTKLLARLGAAFFSGDDALLKAVMSFLEDEGFKVIGVDDVLKTLLAPVGVLGKIAPDSQAQADITLGMNVARLLGRLDIGQAVIVENGYVLGVEAAEGTDALIARCAKLRREKHRGVLVKARKPMQDNRADLPTIGPATVEQVHAAGFGGIAIEAQGGLIVDREEMIRRADAAGIFITGIAEQP
jgi:UDP-2,3-diacylglucosamine hydrolase